jgi:hypothetical protein
MDKETTTSVTIDRKTLPGLTGWQSPIMYQRKTSFPVRWNTSRSTASTRLNMKVRQRKCRNLSNAVIR